jgi:hypothetical protein
MICAEEHGGPLDSPGFGHGGPLDSPANAVAERKTERLRARVSILNLFMVFSSNREVAYDFLNTGGMKPGFMKSVFIFFACAALNTSRTELTQGFYHQHRKVGLT